MKTLAPSIRSEERVSISTGWIGQQWQEGSTSNLNLRSDDPEGGDGDVRVLWDDAEFFNGGETVTVSGSESTKEPPESTVYLYMSSTGGSEIAVTTTDLDDTFTGWQKFLLDSVETVADGSTGTNVGTTGGDGPGTVK
jgi:hypothetical protein